MKGIRAGSRISRPVLPLHRPRHGPAAGLQPLIDRLFAERANERSELSDFQPLRFWRLNEDDVDTVLGGGDAGTLTRQRALQLIRGEFVHAAADPINRKPDESAENNV